MTTTTATDTRPSSDEVAVVDATRTIDEGGAELGVFTDITRPTDVQCDALIDQASNEILGQLPVTISDRYDNWVRSIIVLRAAILVETSFYADQIHEDSVRQWESLIADGLSKINDAVGGSESRGAIDSIVIRSTMTEYDPYYPPPPPPLPVP